MGDLAEICGITYSRCSDEPSADSLESIKIEILDAIGELEEILFSTKSNTDRARSFHDVSNLRNKEKEEFPY